MPLPTTLLSEVGNAGLRPAAPRLAVPRCCVSPAEQRVLDLLGQGASNREIAAGLYLSVRTVESHVSALLAKTGCRSRTQLVLWSLSAP